jgi:hypothetical protein
MRGRYRRNSRRRRPESRSSITYSKRDRTVRRCAAWRSFRQIAARPLATVFSAFFTSRLQLIEDGQIRHRIACVDTIAPWSLKAYAMVAVTIGQALRRANIKSVPDC